MASIPTATNAKAYYAARAEIESAKLRYQLNLADDLAVAAQSLAQLGYVCLSRLMENGDATVIHSGPL